MNTKVKKVKKGVVKYVYEGRKLPVNATIVGKVLEDLSNESESKQITPEQLVDSARHPDSPIHKCFEWNDTVAAEKYRIEQARTILQCVKVEFLSDGKPLITRAFVNIVENNEQFYVPIQVATSSVSMTEYLYQEGKNEMLRLKKKYANIKEFNKVFSEISKLK